MADQPISSDQIIEPSFFDEAIRKAEEFIVLEKELLKTSNANLRSYKSRISSMKVVNSQSLKEEAAMQKLINDELIKTEKLKQAAAQTEQALSNAKAASSRAEQADIRLKNQKNKEVEKEIRAIKTLTPAYDSLKRRYNDISRAIIELSVTGEKGTESFKSLSAEATVLRARLDEAEQGAGRFQRNVGNYKSAFDGLGVSVLQVTRELPAFTVSANTGFLAISNNLPMLFDELQKINKENAKLASEGKKGESALKQLGGALLGWQTALSIGITLLTIYGGKIVNVISSLFEQKDAFEENTEAVAIYNEEIERSIELQKDLQKNIDDATISTLKNKGLLTDASAAALRALDNQLDAFEKNEKERINNVTKLAQQILTTSDKDAKIAVTNADNIISIENKKTGEIIRLNKEANQVVGSFSAFYNKQLFTLEEEAFKKRLIGINEKDTITKNLIKARYDSEIEQIASGEKKKNDKVKEKGKEQEKELVDLSDRIRKLNILDQESQKQIAIQMALFEEDVAIREIKKLNATQKQKQELIIATQKDTFNKLAKIEEDYRKEEDDRIRAEFKKNIEARTEIIFDNAEFEIFILEDKYKTEKEKGKEASKTEIERLKNLIIDKKALLIQAKADEDKIGKTEIEKLAIQNKAEIDIKKLRLEHAKTDADIEKQIAQQKLKDAIDLSSRLIDIVAKEEGRKFQLRQDSFNRQISDTDKNIETQRRLAERGLDNTLAEEQAEKIKQQRQQEEDKKREIKIQKTLAFFKLFAAYSEKDPNTALPKALRDTVIAEAISGSFFKGTENVERDLQGSKVHNNRDGYVIAVDGQERIFNPEQSAKIPLSLGNDEAAEILSQYGKTGLNKLNVIKPRFENIAMLQAAALQNEIVELKNIVKNRPHTKFELDAYGDFITTTIENGFIKITKNIQNKPRI